MTAGTVGTAPGTPALRTLIVEDEPLARRTMRDFVREAPGLVLAGEAADGREAVDLIDALRPDLVLLDVTLPERSGLEVLDVAAYRPPAVVFTTAHEHFAVAAFEREVLDYLLKPVTRERFRAAVARVERRLAPASLPGPIPDGRPAAGTAPAAPLTRVLARRGRTLVPVRLADVARLEADGDFVALHVGGERLLVALPLAECERRLDPQRFRRVHRSHIVNLDHLARAEVDDRRLVLHLRDGSRVVTSRAGVEALRDLIA